MNTKPPVKQDFASSARTITHNHEANNAIATVGRLCIPTRTITHKHRPSPSKPPHPSLRRHTRSKSA